jgi:predicted DNA-binding transcriptional regulator AlpA
MPSNVVGQNSRRYLAIPEVSTEYGGSPAFWRKAVFLRRVAYTKFGRAVRIARADIEAYLASRRVEAR